jgi:hypothetical protein
MVTAYEPSRKGDRYVAKVKNVLVQKASHCLLVTLENLDQGGRLHEQRMSLPIHPHDRTARFFTACAVNVGPVGTEICVDAAIDAVLIMRFLGLGPDGTEDFDFEPISKPPAADEAASA